jgi:hypothetical protein
MSQVYLIRKGNINETSDNGYLEFVFKDYSEARKLAQKLVKAYNRKNSRRDFYVPGNPVSNEMIEIFPDKWTSRNDIIEVAVFQLKNIKQPKKSNNTKYKNPEISMSQEIMFSR